MQIIYAKGQFWGDKVADRCKVKGSSAVSCSKTAEQIEMPFGMWTWVGPRKHALDRAAHWRNLANTIEPSICAGDAALRQITLTTRYYYYFYTHVSVNIFFQELHVCRNLTSWVRQMERWRTAHVWRVSTTSVAVRRLTFSPSSSSWAPPSVRWAAFFHHHRAARAAFITQREI